MSEFDSDEYLKSCNTQELNGMYLNSVREGDQTRAARMLDFGAEVNYAGGGALTAAADSGDINMVKFLLERGLQPTEYVRQEALGDAVFAGNSAMAAFLIDNAKSDPAANDSAALFSAVVNNHAETARVLLEKGADIHANKDTLLCISLSRKFNGVAKVLLDHGADPRKYYRDMNAYEWAASEGASDISAALRHWSNTDVYMSPGFFQRQTVAELRGLYDDKQKDTGFVLAAEAGCFDIVRDKILATPGEKLLPDDLTNRKGGRKSALQALGEHGQLAMAFDAQLWLGRKEAALRLYAQHVPQAFRDQVDPQKLVADIDLAMLKKHGHKVSLKPKAP